MIVRARTPKCLSWAGRLAVMGIAALLLPLAPSWAHQDETAARPARVDRLTPAGNRKSNVDLSAGPDRVQSEQQAGQADSPRERLALLTRDDDKNGDRKDDHDGELSERIEKTVKDLIDTLGDELKPLGEEVRKAIEKALDEVHRSLENDGVSVESLRRGLENAYNDLRGTVEQGGPVNDEMRRALERSRQQIREAADRARADIDRARADMERARDELRQRMQSDAARDRDRVRDRAERDQRDSTQRKDAPREREPTNSRSDSDRRTDEPAKDASKDSQGQPSREQLETARREIRDLEVQLRRATRRLEQLQRRELSRGATTRRQVSPDADSSQPRSTTPAPPDAPRPPGFTGPPGTPGPGLRRPFAPGGPGAPGRMGAPRGGTFGPQPNYEQRFRDLDDKLDRLLKEFEKLKDKKDTV
jgi:hypothetical protein